jgi:thiosulfate dehydrogenase (quinone) large subunit
MSTVTETTPATSPRTGTVVMDRAGTIRLPRGGAIVAAVFRIGLGLLYLWGFLEAGLGVGYTNTKTTTPTSATATTPAPKYGWYFSYDANKGWISSGFTHSPTKGYISSTHGPTAPILKHLPTGVDDFGWVFAIGGLGIALTLGIFMGIAGWGGFALNLMIWLAGFPPDNNPIIDGEHMAFAFGILLLMFLQAGNYWGLGNWWRRHTPRVLH